MLYPHVCKPNFKNICNYVCKCVKERVILTDTEILLVKPTYFDPKNQTTNILKSGFILLVF